MMTLAIWMPCRSPATGSAIVSACRLRARRNRPCTRTTGAPPAVLARRWRLALFFALVCLPGSGRAEPAVGAATPVCAAASVGIVACIAGRLCRCGLAPGGSLAGAPDGSLAGAGSGHRWDCGILRPYCRALDATTATDQPVAGPTEITVPVVIAPRVPKPHRRPRHHERLQHRAR